MTCSKHPYKTAYVTLIHNIFAKSKFVSKRVETDECRFLCWYLINEVCSGFVILLRKVLFKACEHTSSVYGNKLVCVIQQGATFTRLVKAKFEFRDAVLRLIVILQKISCTCRKTSVRCRYGSQCFLKFPKHKGTELSTGYRERERERETYAHILKKQLQIFSYAPFR